MGISKFTALTLLICFSLSWNFPGDQLTWYSFDEGLTKAKAENKHVLIDVYTDWCGWCKVMEQKTYSDPDIIKYLNAKFILVKLNPEKDGSITYNGKKYSAAQFSEGIGVNGYPATAFFESDSKMVTLVPGYIQAKEFLNIIQYIGEKEYYQISFDDYLKGKSAP
ncbi:DUF255 domain-containing protein [bacterium]|nr:DUF255 domain-containing protein [bacterium]